MIGISSFHGITAVAELKVSLPITSRNLKSRFHGITAVAELKVNL